MVDDINIQEEGEFDYLNEQESDSSSQESNQDKQAQEQEQQAGEEKQEPATKQAEAKPTEKPEEANLVIFVVKVTTNKEDKALEIISEKVRKKSLNVYAIARPHGLRGYIFLEAPDRENAEEAVFNLPYVKGIIPQRVSYDEIKQMIEPSAAEIKIEKNDIVEMISEPFKKEKAKVLRLDKQKGEAVVSLLGAAVPMPVTVKIDNLRVIRREDEEE
ncbi:MAG: transcription elongation factor Spt5 [Candidatus Nanoarchaeia archaeon]